MIFDTPQWLFALLALPLAVLAEIWLTGRDRQRLARLVARPLWDRVVRRPNERWRWIRLTLVLLGAAGLIVALARPQWGIVREKIEREGVDVVLVLDTSGSMATPDVAPNRFFLARQALLQLMTRLEGDRFALVACEGEAYPLAPLTLDADAVGLFLETAEPGIVPAPGTSLGVGLTKGLEAFVDEERRNKVLVLVSDGEDLEGDVDNAVAAAREAGVIVHTVGVGTEAGEPVPAFDSEGRATGYKRDASGAPVVSRLNTATLEAIASGTGGRMFRLTASNTSLGALASVIEGMERRALAREWSYRRRERYQGPLALGLLLLMAGLLLPLPRLRRTGKARQAAALVAAATLLAAEPGAGAAPAAGAAGAEAAPAGRAERSGTGRERISRSRISRIRISKARTRRARTRRTKKRTSGRSSSNRARGRRRPRRERTSAFASRPGCRRSGPCSSSTPSRRTRRRSRNGCWRSSGPRRKRARTGEGGAQRDRGRRPRDGF